MVILPTGFLFVDCYDCGLAERIGVGESELLLRVKCAQTVKWYKAGKDSCFRSTKEAADFFCKVLLPSVHTVQGLLLGDWVVNRGE